MRATNVVLYSLDVGFVRKPLISISPDDVMGAAKLQHAASQEYRKNDAQGVPHSELVCVRETRDADEQGKATFAEYVRTDLSGKEIGAVVSKLADLFTGIVAAKLKEREDAERERAARVAAEKGSE